MYLVLILTPDSLCLPHPHCLVVAGTGKAKGREWRGNVWRTQGSGGERRGEVGEGGGGVGGRWEPSYAVARERQ